MTDVSKLRRVTLHDDQWFAIKRIHSICDGRAAEQFDDPELKEALRQIRIIAEKYLKAHPSHRSIDAGREEEPSEE